MSNNKFFKRRYRISCFHKGTQSRFLYGTRATSEAEARKNFALRFGDDAIIIQFLDVTYIEGIHDKY